ncbi:hypothetical protein M5X00_13160 [Paenibacillus alvei]|uniref:hypothetical protein n=1 Tax=Paenibacillus alvei TaxID=44250 RepID=UPI000287D9BD|nr:hypothetical protein [Paenibacillus alvei]EJW13796.1 hypothetical protein PAV_109p00260 [Paenibacillus alvei DSM 29]MCY9540527.1 hypothetical protein [Paenibacillus alvei]MCY9708268.1 hypothetical protein [Paenibacillus alvei]MCY9732936.1 hypothetical protein [Paenibacillus alvei]MCY9755189.1 hypothetical protein [Paenibacillus alvei]
MIREAAITQIQEAYWIYDHGSIEINGVRVDVKFWSPEDLEEYCIVQNDPLCEVEIDLPIYYAAFNSQILITNDESSILSLVSSEEEFSFKMLEGTFTKFVDPDLDYEDESGFLPFHFPGEDRWGVPTRICSVGGCEYDFVMCSTEEEARNKGLEMTREGKELEVSGICPTCRNGYMD